MAATLQRLLAAVRSRTEPLRISRFGRTVGEARSHAREEHISLLAAGLSYYGMLAVVPGLIAVVSIYGLIADAGDVAGVIDKIGSAAPAEVTALLEGQLTDIIDVPAAGLGISAAVSLLVALWAASSGTKALLRGVNAAFGLNEARRGLRLRLVSLGLTAGLVVFVVIAVLAVSVSPTWLDGVLSALQWLLVFVIASAGLSLLYRFGPAQRPPGWRMWSLGALAAAIGWLGASYGLGQYVTRFGSFNETYGALGAVIVTMLWLFVSGFAVLAGAVLDGVLAEVD